MILTIQRATLAVAAALLLVAAATAQEIVGARITGTIVDATGAALPGVTVTLTGPALQVPQLVQTSDGEGHYQFLDLRIGTYKVQYELQGFSGLVREGIVLTTGFAARIDVPMKIGAVEETITVSGQSPVVDVVNTRGGATVTTEVIESIPNSKVLADIASLAGAGVQYRGAPLQGEAGERVQLQESSGALTYGQSARVAVGVEGIRSPVNEMTDWNIAEEVDVKSYGNGAEQDGSGARIGLIVKSGGNDFHGNYRFYGQHKSLTANNIDDALRRQGLTTPDIVTWYYDVTGDLGGRLIRDKLWFYGALRRLANDRLVSGSSQSRGADNVYGTSDDPVGQAPAHTLNQVGKISYQATPSHRFVVFGARDDLFDGTEDSLSRYTPFESTAQFRTLAKKGKVEWQSIFGPRLFASLLYGESGYKAFRSVQDVAIGIPAQFDVTSTESRGGRFTNTLGWRIPNAAPQLSGNVTYLPPGTLLGTHKVTAGVHIEWQEFISHFEPSPAGDYQLRFTTSGGLGHQPFQLTTVNRPVIGNSQHNTYAIYGADEWRISKRLTLNVGLRWEAQDSWVPAQSREAGDFSPAATFARIDVGRWSHIAGRTGVAFDLFGDGRTVAKATYGRFYTPLDINFANEQNKNTITTTTYLWRDPNRDGLYQPGEVNLDVNGPDFVSIAGGNVNTPPLADLAMPYTDEISFSVERELWNGVALRGLFVNKRETHQFASINILRPLSVWNRQFTRAIPGPDGLTGTADDGGALTIYDYDPAYRGAAFVSNRNTNRPEGRDDWYRNFELGLRKRGGRQWLPLSISFLATKNHRWLTSVPQSPNDDLFPLDETWSISGKVNGGYNLPYGILVAGEVAGYSGVPAQETYLFPAGTGAGAFPSSTGGLTLRVGEYGAVSAPVRYMTNARAAKILGVGGSRKLKLDADVFNVFNTNVPWSSGAEVGISFLQGPTYGQISRIMTPRVLRLGASLSF